LRGRPEPRWTPIRNDAHHRVFQEVPVLRRLAPPVLITLVVSLAIAAPAAAQPEFTVVVDSANGFDPFGFGCPAVNDTGTVVFQGFTANGVQVIMTWTNGRLARVATNRRDFDFLGRNPSINDDRLVSFAATLSEGGEAILRARGNRLTTIAETETGPFNFFSFDTSIAGRGRVAFKAELDSEFGFDEGLFVGNGATVRTIWLASTSQFSGTFSRPAINDAGQIAFDEFLDDFTFGIFRAERDGSFTTIVDPDGPVSPATQPSMNDPGVVAFVGFPDSGGAAVFTGDGGPLITVVDDKGPFASFQTFAGPSINDSGVVAFGASLDDGTSGIFIGPDPVSDRVIGTGDALAGSTVSNLTVCWEGLNDSGQIVFKAELDDGRTVIVLATP
jgi:hypothetical protein